MSRYRLTRGKLIQRVLMKKTGCHVYYLHDRGRDLIEIHSIWGGIENAAPVFSLSIRAHRFGVAMRGRRFRRGSWLSG